MTIKSLKNLLMTTFLHLIAIFYPNNGLWAGDIVYYDVADLHELPSPPQGFRYFDFLGGTKEIRCFLVPEETPRGTFIEENENLLDDCLKPIFKNEGICVRQDTSYPLPGFYIIYPVKNYRSLDEVDEVTHIRLFAILHEIRKGMREVLGINYAHVYYEEKSSASCNVHFWLIPINDIKKHPRIYQFDVKSYLETFIFSQNKSKILECNEKMRAYLKEIDLLQRDQQLMLKLTPSLDFN